MDISIVILTYNRPDMLAENLRGLSALRDRVRELIVVDNSSNDETGELVASDFDWVDYVRNDNSAGVAGRNTGMDRAVGEIVVTLDDDVTGLAIDDLDLVASAFADDDELGGLCFRVLHHETGEVCNWCHHRRVEDAMANFDTYEISEGAVAFRVAALSVSGLYCEDFFISHEGKDLAYRLMNAGYRVGYDGRIAVRHHIAAAGRANWRRYYYDTRNSIWLAVRNMPPGYGARFLFTALASMAVYSLRDGFFGHWLRAVRDGFAGWRRMRRKRRRWTERTERLCREIDRRRPGVAYKLKHRLLRRGVQI